METPKKPLDKAQLNTAIAKAPQKPEPVEKAPFIDSLSKCILLMVEQFYNKADGVEFPMPRPQWESMFVAPESHMETEISEDVDGNEKSEVVGCKKKPFTNVDMTKEFQDLFEGMDELGFTYTLNKQKPSVTILWRENPDYVKCYPVPY